MFRSYGVCQRPGAIGCSDCTECAGVNVSGAYGTPGARRSRARVYIIYMQVACQKCQVNKNNGLRVLHMVGIPKYRNKYLPRVQIEPPKYNKNNRLHSIPRFGNQFLDLGIVILCHCVMFGCHCVIRTVATVLMCSTVRYEHLTQCNHVTTP